MGSSPAKMFRSGRKRSPTIKLVIPERGRQQKVLVPHDPDLQFSERATDDMDDTA